MADWSFIEHCTEHMLAPRIGDPRDPNLWPSEATAEYIGEDGKPVVVGKCRRATFLRFANERYKFYSEYADYEKLSEEIKLKILPPDKYMLWIWRAGDLYEDHITNLAKESGVYISSQNSVFIPEVRVSGKIDIITINPATGKHSIVEVKSVYGHGGRAVFNTPGQIKLGKMGEPRDSNLMQIAIYDWWFAGKRAEDFEKSRLIYGSRDTGQYCEYYVYTVEREDGDWDIFYEGLTPNATEPVKLPYTINNIIDQYRFAEKSVRERTIPDRDYTLQHSDEKLAELYAKGELGKEDTKKHENMLEFRAGKKKKEPAKIIKGDWQCRYCNYRNLCYQSTDPKDPNYGVPRELSAAG